MIEAAEALQYVPSQRGRSLATRSTGQIGIVVSDLGNPFYLQVLDELHRALSETPLRMLVLTPDGNDAVPFERLVDGSLDGAVLTTTLLDSSLPAALSERGFPFVLLNREVDDAPCDVCVVDNHLGGMLAAGELIELGHTEIAALFGPSTTSTGRDREAGFRATARGGGHPAARAALPPGAVRLRPPATRRRWSCSTPSRRRCSAPTTSWRSAPSMRFTAGAFESPRRSR